MARLQLRSFATSGEVRDFPNGYTSVVQLDETVVGYGVYQPGFRWATDLSAIAGTPTCPLHHIGYAISGVLHVLTDAGDELDIRERSVYELPPGHDAWVVGDEPFVSIDWTSARTWGPMAEGVGNGVIVTIVFTDIVDSTAMVRRVGDQGWRERLATHHARMRDHLNGHRGRAVKTTGDGMLAVFDRPVRAVRCAEDMVATSRAMELPIRVGIHTGEVELAVDDARGLAVHTAERVMSLGGPDDVMISSTARDLLEGSEIAFEDAGEHELKGLPGLRRVFRLRH
jgi:class 3 adenylate cyclase